MTLRDKIRERKMNKMREKCHKKLLKEGKIGPDSCPGKSSKIRDFCYFEEACFNCKYWV